MSSIGLIVITKNEEKYLARCLESCHFVDQIVIVDSFSTDSTCEIARKFTPNVYQKAWTNWLEQRMHGIEKLETEWILIMDADEYLSTGAQAYIQNFCQSTEADMLEIPRRNLLLGEWVAHSGWYPDWQQRFIRKSTLTSNQEVVHTRFFTTGVGARVDDEAACYIGHNTCDGLHYYFEKMNMATTMEAEYFLGEHPFVLNKMGIFSRSLGMFTQSFFHFKGYRDGMRGLIVAGFCFVYSFMMMTKLWALEEQQRRDAV